MSAILANVTRRVDPSATAARRSVRIEPATSDKETRRYAGTALLAALLLWVSFGLPLLVMAFSVGAEIPTIVICGLHLTIASVVFGGILAGLFMSGSDHTNADHGESVNSQSTHSATTHSRPTRRAA